MPDSAIPEPVDPFDPAALRATGDVNIPTEKPLTAVPVRRPKRDEFFRVREDESFTMDAWVLERDGDRENETYIVTPACVEVVSEVARKVRLFTCMSKKETLFLWPCKFPIEGSSGRRYADTALKIAEDAKALWVRMWGDRNLGGYRYVRARADLPEPKWPDQTFRELLRMAFEQRIIDRPDHEVIRELSGDL